MTAASVVVVTMGGRERELAAALDSVARQQVAAETVVVGNGVTPGVAASKVIVLAENLGVSGGRNAGWAAATGEVVFFLDDDARYAGEAVIGSALAIFAADDRVGVVSLRIVDETGRVARKHIPMLRKRPVDRVAAATSFLGGACAIRRTLLEQLAGFPAEFRYGLEETDFAWRAIDRGWRVVYAGDLVVIHPEVPIRDRRGALEQTARSRVLLVRRRLPWVLAIGYLMIRGTLSLAAVRSIGDLRTLFAGYRAGWRDDPGPRQPISWGTVWRLTRLGRPPLV